MNPPPAPRRPPVGGPGAPAQARELRRRGKATMRRLLDAAVEVFARRGYHAARVDDIVKRAHTSHGTFYLYFANKEDVFRALTEDVAEQMTDLVSSLDHLEPGPDGLAALRSWVGHFAELYRHYGPVIRAWTEAETDTTEFGQLGNQMFGEIAGTFAARIATGPAQGIDPQVASLALLAMVERFNFYALSGQVAIDQDEMLDALAQLLHDSLFGRQSTAGTRS